MKNKRIEIPIPGLFNAQECLWFLSRDFDDCMYKVFDDKVRRAFKSDNGIMLVDIYLKPDEIVIEWLNGNPPASGIDAVTAFVTSWFDLESDLNSFYMAITKDKRLSYLADKYKGLRFIGIPDLFEALSWCIIGQQINLSFAYKVKRRLVEQYGEHIEYSGQKYYLFPSTETLSEAKRSDLRELQFSERKAEYLVTIAQAFCNGSLNKGLLLGLPDLESRLKFLTGIKGIGKWTANYALMKSLKEPSCIPYGDAGLLNALIHHDIIKSKDDSQSIDRFFEMFPGQQSYLVFYLWRTLSQPRNETSKPPIKVKRPK